VERSLNRENRLLSVTRTRATIERSLDTRGCARTIGKRVLDRRYITVITSSENTISPIDISRSSSDYTDVRGRERRQLSVAFSRLTRCTTIRLYFKFNPSQFYFTTKRIYNARSNNRVMRACRVTRILDNSHLEKLSSRSDSTNFPRESLRIRSRANLEAS